MAEDMRPPVTGTDEEWAAWIAAMDAHVAEIEEETRRLAALRGRLETVKIQYDAMLARRKEAGRS